MINAMLKQSQCCQSPVTIVRLPSGRDLCLCDRCHRECGVQVVEELDVHVRVRRIARFWWFPFMVREVEIAISFDGGQTEAGWVPATKGAWQGAYLPFFSRLFPKGTWRSK